MTPARLALLAVGAAWLAAATPARAADISDRDVERAREACANIAERRDWKVKDTDLRDRDEDRDRVTVSVSGTRNGEDRTRECRYNVKSGDAEFEDQ